MDHRLTSYTFSMSFMHVPCWLPSPALRDHSLKVVKESFVPPFLLLFVQFLQWGKQTTPAYGWRLLVFPSMYRCLKVSIKKIIYQCTGMQHQWIAFNIIVLNSLIWATVHEPFFQKPKLLEVCTIPLYVHYIPLPWAVCLAVAMVSQIIYLPTESIYHFVVQPVCLLLHVPTLCHFNFQTANFR